MSRLADIWFAVRSFILPGGWVWMGTVEGRTHREEGKRPAALRREKP